VKEVHYKTRCAQHSMLSVTFEHLNDFFSSSSFYYIIFILNKERGEKMLVIQHVNTIWEMFYTTFNSFIRFFASMKKTSRFFMSLQKGLLMHSPFMHYVISSKRFVK